MLRDGRTFDCSRTIVVLPLDSYLSSLLRAFWLDQGVKPSAVQLRIMSSAEDVSTLEDVGAPDLPEARNMDVP